MATITVGGVILMEALFAGPITKALMHPVNALAPSLFRGNFQKFWFYICAPITGKLLAVSSCKLVKDNNCC
ncbi:aquaporin [Aestuariivivens sediminicola]|uniref:aquaporin n=1 Tax=Aestuariivivens sediminicola TaxID=2913560 RepID=UPI001F57EF3E|nr:aquaporin [Aestuariivivens sediminicola]